MDVLLLVARVTAGYLVSCVLGAVIAGYCVRRMWRLVDETPEYESFKNNGPIVPPPTISKWHGVAERAVYTTAIVLGRPEGIAAWLAFKALMRVKVDEDKDRRHIPGSNIYLIGTALNLAFGVAGGLIVTAKSTF